MNRQAAAKKHRPRTTEEIAEMIGTGRVLDAAIRRAVREAVRRSEAPKERATRPLAAKRRKLRR